ncbi:protein fem-1 homolog A [Ischnura elegans]|uniref:protein fem-1 homolog A n=1 Tax=Ischnura elegans TaxID=197161 RepID=UPI001ED873E1|nr:protein fem-1 homolog A [Ischnura elegans]
MRLDVLRELIALCVERSFGPSVKLKQLQSLMSRGGLSKRLDMWITGKLDSSHQKEILFNDLYAECKHAAPGARLSYQLRTRLEKLSREDRKEVVSRTKDGCAPLFLACKRGHAEIVEYLITVCDADVEQRGLYEVQDDRSVHCVTPLWCAAVSGRLVVVKSLIGHGAQVDAVSDTGSTPVRSACFMTHLDVVAYLVVEGGADVLRPNYNGGTCLINSVQSVQLCLFLLEHGAQVNARDIQNKTALHYAIQEHRLETTRLLLDHGADPHLCSRYGDDALQTACLKGATQIFEHLCQRVGYSPERIADAHDLLGSTFLDEHADAASALEHWHAAAEIRRKAAAMKEAGVSASNSSTSATSSSSSSASCSRTTSSYDDSSMDTDGSAMESEAEPEDPPPQVSEYEASRAAIFDEVESNYSRMTLDEVMKIGAEAGADVAELMDDRFSSHLPAVDPPLEQADIGDLDALRLYSLQVCERVLGPAHKDTVFRLMYRGAAYADAQQYQRCIDLWRHALEIRVAKDSILYGDTCFTAQALVRLFLVLHERQMPSRERGESNRFEGHEGGAVFAQDRLRHEDALGTLWLLARQLKEGHNLLLIHPIHKRQEEAMDRTLRCVTHLMHLALANAPTPHAKYLVTQAIKVAVASNVRTSQGDTLLHLAVSRMHAMRGGYIAAAAVGGPVPFPDEAGGGGSQGIFPCLDVIQTILECGAPVNARNESYSTPLHVAAEPANFNREVFSLLLEHGAHLDQPNRTGLEPVVMLRSIPEAESFRLLQYTSLKCLAAKVVVRQCIPYWGGRIPRTLESFVRMHEWY